MGFFEISKTLLNKTLTENGDLAFKSSGSSCLDYFALIGGKRQYLKEAAILFVNALDEDFETAAKLLFYTRDPRKGIGERRLFRFLFNMLSTAYPDKTIAMLPFIAKYGRYDDLLCTLGTPVESETIALIEAQLQEDIQAKKEGKPISLLAKWLPSINTSSAETRQIALALSEKLGMSKADYRKMLSSLRQGMIVENDLRQNKYDFDYEKVPSLAMHKYQKAFKRNDMERFTAYLANVNEGKAEMKVSVGDPVSLIHRFNKELYKDKPDVDYYEAAWKAFVNEGEIHKKTLVVRDGSGSMTVSYGGGYHPIEVANAMTLLTSARLTGEFHDRFITFSAEPEIVDLTKKKTLADKLMHLNHFCDCSNTNIQKVYELVLDVYKNKNFKKEDAINQLLIVSDMEFDVLRDDEGNEGLMSTFEYFKSEFAKLGYDRPEIVFWNVNARGQHVPVTEDETGVKLVSGSSKNIIDMVSMTDSLDPKEFMLKTLETYQNVADALKEAPDE